MKTSIPKDKIDEVHKLLYWSGYRQIKILTENAHLKTPTYFGIEIHANAIAMQTHIDSIKSLLGGMGLSVEGDTNREIITIK